MDRQREFGIISKRLACPSVLSTFITTTKLVCDVIVEKAIVNGEVMTVDLISKLSRKSEKCAWLWHLLSSEIEEGWLKPLCQAASLVFQAWINVA
jgi:hypothetical protein